MLVGATHDREIAKQFAAARGEVDRKLKALRGPDPRNVPQLPQRVSGFNLAKLREVRSQQLLSSVRNSTSQCALATFSSFCRTPFKSLTKAS
jgi:hypothetical protein